MNEKNHQWLIENSYKFPSIRLPRLCGNNNNGKQLASQLEFNTTHPAATLLCREVSTLTDTFLDGLYSVLSLNNYATVIIEGSSDEHYNLHRKTAIKYSITPVRGRRIH